MSLAGVDDAPPPYLSTKTNTFPSLMHGKSTTTTTNLQISPPRVMNGMMFPVSTPLEGPIYIEREKSAIEKAAEMSTLNSAFISAPATGTTPAAASAASGPAPRAAGRSANANTDIVWTRGVPVHPIVPHLASTRPTNVEGASHPPSPPPSTFLPPFRSLFPLTMTSYLDGPHFAYDKSSAFNYSTPVTPESYQTLLMNECRLSEINIGRNVSFFL